MKRTNETETAPETQAQNMNLDEAGTGEVERENLAHETGAETSVVEGAEKVLEAAGATPPKTGRFDFNPGRVASTRRGAKVRNNIFYEIVGVPGENVKMQPQKALCLQLINANTSDEKPLISEPELFAILEAAKADGTLETRQEAKRIWAYYKADLVDEGYIVEHNQAPAKKKAS
jgi:hypothetical protein